MDYLKEQQKKTDYSPYVKLTKDGLYVNATHKWNIYKEPLDKLYRNDKLIKEIHDHIYSGYKVSGGKYFQKYIKYKTKYTNLQYDMNN